MRTLTMTGLAFGLAWAVVLTRFMSGLLFAIELVDLLTYAETVFIIFGGCVGSRLFTGLASLYN